MVQNKDESVPKYHKERNILFYILSVIMIFTCACISGDVHDGLGIAIVISFLLMIIYPILYPFKVFPKACILPTASIGITLIISLMTSLSEHRMREKEIGIFFGFLFFLLAMEFGYSWAVIKVSDSIKKRQQNKAVR